MKSNETLTLIEEITRLDDSKYIEISNIKQNGRAELAVEKGLIKKVRILQLNIPRSTHVINYENYINENFEMPSEDLTEFEEWTKNSDMEKEVQLILKENKIS
ncbi:hypothetical protein GSH19_06115 [Lactobacillus sp. S2-2]|uniref:hypothetical protein n=1 Tax=Lactobacillus sp. S2-2 TaxID=2692917 RepID=UPI001F15A2AD|nr:hypothetical protein [Lactobacillus sp. S2-2]MCF6515721.1 hypothetical protein [Lactobacillus sp. S2-2]